MDHMTTEDMIKEEVISEDEIKKNKKLGTNRILLYLGLTFALTIGFSVGLIYPILDKVNQKLLPPVMATMAMAPVMFFPAISVLLTRLITKEGFENAFLKPHFKGNVKYYLLAYFGPGVLTLLGALVYFLIFPEQFDPECGYMKITMEAAGASAEDVAMPFSTLMIVQLIQAMLLGPILNFITCFGEEWGWRGYLLPKMAQKLPAIPMLLVNGIIWGLWHAPLTVVGHNYGVGYPGYPYKGIAAMCLFCLVLGIFLSFVTMKTKSCIPAVLGHGAVNSIAGIGMYFTKDGGNPFIGPAPTGLIGIIPFVMVVILMVIFYFKQFTHPLKDIS